MNISFTKIKKCSIWIQLLLVFMIIYILISIYNNYKPRIEGFTQNKKYVLKTNDNLYDNFYTRIYDKLFRDDGRIKYEIGEMVNLTKMEKDKSNILDIGSGTGHHLGILRKYGFNNLTGIDNSKNMIVHSKRKYPDINFMNGDGTISNLFPPNHFTHIFTLYFTIYYIKDKQTFFNNCYTWLMPGGYLVLHLVNKNRFNPVLNPADPLFLLDIQKYAKDRITTSNIRFNNFQYKSDFKLNGNQGIFKEKFKDNTTHNVRENEHIFYMEKQRDIIELAKNAGFILHGKVDMHTIEYNNQYLYIMYKPE